MGPHVKRCVRVPTEKCDGSGGTIITVFNVANDAGKVIGPVLAGWLVDRGSFGAALGFGVAVLVPAGVSGLRLPRHVPVASGPRWHERT